MAGNKTPGAGRHEATDRAGTMDFSTGIDDWRDFIKLRTTDESPSESPESSTVSRSSSVSMNIPSMSPVVSDEDMRRLHSYAATLLSGFTVDDSSVVAVLKKIDDDIQAATEWSPAKVAVELQDIHAKKALLVGEKMFATYAMLTGKEGASQLYQDATDKYGTLDYVAHNLRTDPEGYYARQRLDLYNQMANYTQALGGAVAADRAATGNMLIGIANILASRAQVESAKIGAQANIYQTDVQRKLTEDMNTVNRMQATSNFFQVFSQLGLPFTGTMFGRVFNVFKQGTPEQVQKEMQLLTDEITNTVDTMRAQGKLTDKQYEEYLKLLAKRQKD